MKIFTAAPLPLTNDSWDRDITLLYRGLESLGVESQCVRLQSTDGTDFPGIITTTRDCLESKEWWRQFKLDALILNTWGNPQNTPIVQAAKDAGIRVLVRMDTGGIKSPWVNPIVYGKNAYSAFQDRRHMKPLKAFIAAIAKVPLYAIPYVYDYKLFEQLRIADFVGVESEDAYARLSRLFKLFKKHHLKEKLAIVRHPAAPDVFSTAIDKIPAKQKCIISVGRWDAYQKNAPLLVSVLIKTLEIHKDYEAHIIGSGQEKIHHLLQQNSTNARNRIHVCGPLSHKDVVRHMLKSKICLLTSRHESGPLVASEALCCGASFFAQDNGSVPLTSIRNIGAGGGVSGGVNKIVKGLTGEIRRWEQGVYNSETIATDSRKVFGYKNVASEALKLLSHH